MYCEATSLVEHDPCVGESETCLCIGDVTVSILSGTSSAISADLNIFRIQKSVPNIAVTLRWADGIDTLQRKMTFDSGAVWKLSREADDFVFDFSSTAIGTGSYKQMRTSDFVSAEMILNAALLPKDVWALEYPADELLITNYLAQYGLGVEVHGCGLIDPERGGFLFLGHSGAGKTTTTRLWQSVRNPEILSDDRIILRLHNGELWMYGTPWHGDAGIASPGRARLSQIFFLEQAPVDQIVPISQSNAAAELFARTFVPFYLKSGIQFSLGFLDQVTRSVPCSTFRFTPAASAVEAIRHARV